MTYLRFVFECLKFKNKTPWSVKKNSSWLFQESVMALRGVRQGSAAGVHHSSEISLSGWDIASRSISQSPQVSHSSHSQDGLFTDLYLKRCRCPPEDQTVQVNQAWLFPGPIKIIKGGTRAIFIQYCWRLLFN